MALGCAPLRAQLDLAFGVYTADKPTVVVSQFRPVLDVLERAMTEALGETVQIRMQVAKTYDLGVQEIATGAVDFARLGPVSYVRAKEKSPGLRILAMETEGGNKTFYGVICVRRDSPIRDVAELRGKSFAFGDATSTIGRYLSQQYLLEHGLQAADLGHYAYLGRHDRVGAAVGNGQFDAGALKETTFEDLVANGVPIRAIARFPNVTKPWVARSGLPEPIEQALRASLLGVRDLEAPEFDGFVEGDDADYAPTRKAMQENAQFFAAQGPE
jgi:phosphonate transport system substrate-binding protein